MGKGIIRETTDSDRTGTARGRPCKRCGFDEWRKTFFGLVGRKIWLALTVIGLGMMVLALYTSWSSITIGSILFILGTLGLLSRQWR